MITSTVGALEVVNIATHPDYVDGDTFASLTVRDGFGGNANADSPVSSMGHDDLRLVDASEFLGDLTLGSDTRVQDLDTLLATGGGDVSFYGQLTGAETAQAYSVTTGEGDDVVDLELSGDALDYAGSSVDVSTGDGEDDIDLFFTADGDDTGGDNEQLNQVILDGVSVDGGDDDDHITVDGIGNANIHGGDGNDVIKTAGSPGPVDGIPDGSNAVWAFNFDPDRVTADGGLGAIDPDELPGVGLDLAFLADATITVVFSGAGDDGSWGDLADGGGVMSIDEAAQSPNSARTLGENGYQASFTIGDLINGNNFFGDQRDVNAAVIAAIENDPILSELLTAELGPNNTLIVKAKDSGAFDNQDLRINVEQAGYDSSTASAILDEAQTLFNDSTLTIADLFGSGSPSDGDAYEGPGGLNNSPASSDAADEWYDGLSVKQDTGEFNSTDINVGNGINNLHTAGTASTAETDNTINGGNDDDLIVMSTDGVGGPLGVPDFETNFGTNNRFLNGASNETIVSDGDNFGYDTIMNFTTAGPMEKLITTLNLNIVEINEKQPGRPDTDVPAVPATTEQFTLRVTPADANNLTSDPITVTFEGDTVTIPAGASLSDVTDAFVADIGTSSGYTVSVDPSDPQLLIFTHDTPGDQTTLASSAFSPNLFTDLNGVVEFTGAESGEPDTNTNNGEDEIAATVLPAQNEIFCAEFHEATEDGVYTFAGQSVTVNAGDSGADIAQAFLNGGDLDGWVATADPGTPEVVTVQFASNSGEANDGVNTLVFDGVTIDFMNGNSGSGFTTLDPVDIANEIINSYNRERAETSMVNNGGGSLTFTEHCAMIPDVVPLISWISTTLILSNDCLCQSTLLSRRHLVKPLIPRRFSSRPKMRPFRVVSITPFRISTLPGLFTGDVNIERDVLASDIHHGLDFLDFTYYLTSIEDTSDNPPGSDSSASNAPIEVELDYNENNTLGGEGDGSPDPDVEANEVAVVRMADDTGDGETFANISASDVQTLFNTGAGDDGFGTGDDVYGNLDAADFDVETYDKVTEPEALIGDAKAIFAVENGANEGEYKYFELTWSGDEDSDSGDVVSAREIGGQDFGASLTDLDDVNLVGSSEHADLDLTDQLPPGACKPDSGDPWPHDCKVKAPGTLPGAFLFKMGGVYKPPEHQPYKQGGPHGQDHHRWKNLRRRRPVRRCQAADREYPGRGPADRAAGAGPDHRENRPQGVCPVPSVCHAAGCLTTGRVTEIDTDGGQMANWVTLSAKQHRNSRFWGARYHAPHGGVQAGADPQGRTAAGGGPVRSGLCRNPG